MDLEHSFVFGHLNRYRYRQWSGSCEVSGEEYSEALTCENIAGDQLQGVILVHGSSLASQLRTHSDLH